MCTVLLIPNSRIRFWKIMSSYLFDGNISKQFSALIVFCDVICSYLCILLMRFMTSDLWHEKWLSAPCVLRAVTWLASLTVFDVSRLYAWSTCITFSLFYCLTCNHCPTFRLYRLYEISGLYIHFRKQQNILVHVYDMIFMKSGSYFPCLPVSLSGAFSGQLQTRDFVKYLPISEQNLNL